MSDSEKLNEKAPHRRSCSFSCCLCFASVLLIPVLVLCATVLIWMFCTKPPRTPVVTIEAGRVQGNIQFSRNGREYWEFLGIPYAMPPTGSRKFKPPVPIKSWQNVKQVTKQPPSCVQLDVLLSTRVIGVLDCLYLNVFVNVENGRNVSKSMKKPVLVYIHGGGYISGGASIYRPDYFMDQDIVLVVMNYRLGPYGFINLEDKNSALGNLGLLDQNLVLKWVQRNIDNFGGDPGKVTVFGESAGAAATHFHVMSPMSRGLFHKAVLMSGSGVAPWAFSRKPREIAEEYAPRIGCSVNEILKCFNETDPDLVVKYQDSLLNPLQKKNLFEPTVDGEFMEAYPLEYLNTGNFSTIPIMLGVNSGEGTLRTGRFALKPDLIKQLDLNWNNISSHMMMLDESLVGETAKQIRSRYFGNSSFTSDIESFYRNLTELSSDSGFFDPLHKTAMYHAKQGAPTYLYYFNYTSNIYPGLYNIFRSIRTDGWLPSEVYMYWTLSIDWLGEHIFGVTGSHKYGVSHGEDLFQLWNCDGLTRWLSRFDSNFSQSFIQVLVDFANTTSSLEFRGVAWPSLNSHLAAGKDEYTAPFMLMDNDPVPITIPEPFGKKLKFWRELAHWKY